MKRLACGIIALAMAGCSSSEAPLRTTATHPATKVVPVTESLHGVSVTDNYRWLEGDNSDPNQMGKVTPDVAAWTDQQNAYTRQVLDNLPGRARSREAPDAVAPGRRRERAGHSRQPVFLLEARGHAEPAGHLLARRLQGRRPRADRSRRSSTRSGLTTIEWTTPSQDGKTVAYGTYRSGDENTMLHLSPSRRARRCRCRSRTRRRRRDWLPDDSGFVYQNLKNAKDPYPGQVMFHRMGQDPAKDVILFRQYTKDENAKLATTWGPNGGLSRDGHWLLLGYWIDTKSNDLWLVELRRLAQDRQGRQEDLDDRGKRSGVRHRHQRHALSADDEGRAEGARCLGEPARPDRKAWKDDRPGATGLG